MNRLLANENIPQASILFLRNSGFNVLSISEDYPGITDEYVLSIAHQEERTILTFDRDYGELMYSLFLNPLISRALRQKRLSGL